MPRKTPAQHDGGAPLTLEGGPVGDGCCGVDEAGRGPLAGPVYAAAVILDPQKPIFGLADSKTLSEKKRLTLDAQIRCDAIAFAVAFASVEEVDSLNVLRASLLAMRRAVEALAVRPTKVLIDGLHLPTLSPTLSLSARAIINGDQLVAEISAASILAKTARDAEMVKLCKQFPGYGFSRHKGYGTREHMAALKRYGPCSIHRQSFAPVRESALQFSFHQQWSNQY